MTLTQIDHVKGIIAQALCEGLTIDDLWICIEHAASVKSFDDAVNILATAMPIEEIEQ